MSYTFECMQCRRSWTSRHVPEARRYSYRAITRECRHCQSEVSLERVKYLCSICEREWETFRNDEGLSCNSCGTTVLPNSEEHSEEEYESKPRYFDTSYQWHQKILPASQVLNTQQNKVTNEEPLEISEQSTEQMEDIEEVTFSSIHSENVRLEQERRLACRFNGSSKGIVVTSAPVPSDMLFQVEIMEMDSNWSGSLSIGVTALQPEVVVSANKADELTGQSFVITPSTSKGTAVLCVGGQDMGELPGDIDLHGLKVGDTIGLLYTSSGTLHFFFNGVNMVKLPYAVPMGVYGLVDLHGQCVKVTLRPLTLWSGGDPRHVMADKEAQDRTRNSLAKQQYEEAIKQGSVDMSIIKCLVLGIAGVGKTHLKRLLLSEKTDGKTGRVSTGLADNPVQAFVGSIKSILAGVDEKDTGNWEVLDEAKLMQVLANACNVDHSTPPSVPILKIIPSHSAAYKEPSRSTEDAVSMSDNKVQSPPTTEHNEVPLEPPPMEDNGSPAADKVSLFIDAFKNAIDQKKVPNLKVTLVSFIDSGGQPQFLDLLPAFVQDVSAVLFVVNMSENLDHCPEICFYDQDSRLVGKPYISPSSHKQLFEQCVRAAHTRDVHPHVLVVGTHRDEEHKCSEKRKDKDKIIKKMPNPEFLISKKGHETIWEVNSKSPEPRDEEVANSLKKSIVAHCKSKVQSPLPMKWFGLEIQIRVSAKHGVLSLSTCQLLAQKLDINEQGLEAALLHMVKYNLFLWYHDIPALREVVFSDPQVILKIITDLVQCKHELAGDDVPQLLCGEGVKNDWCIKFRDHAIVSHDFLSLKHFEKHFVDGIFTVKHFTSLMCHRFIMVPLNNSGDFLMPALLDPLSSDKICLEQEPVEPLLLCFEECVPQGVFSSLVAFVQQNECTLVENEKVPVRHYKNCVYFVHNDVPAKFTIVDSVAYIEVHLNNNCTTACFRIRELIHEGIKKCAQVLHYTIGQKDLRDGFICFNKSCKGVAIPFKEDKESAKCTHCSDIMSLKTRHTVWFVKKEMQEPLRRSMRNAKRPAQDGDVSTPPKRNRAESLSLDSQPTLALLEEKVVAEIPNMYEAVGIQLGLKYSEIQALRPACPGLEPCRQAYRAILDLWQKNGSPPYTWRTVINVLNKVGEKSLSSAVASWIERRK